MNNTKNGFTLLEMLIVIGILGMLMAMAYTGLAQAQRTARIAKANTEIRQIVGAWYAYEAAKGDWPSDMPVGEALPADVNTLGKLLGGLDGTTDERRLVFLDVPLKNGVFYDPWRTPYNLKITKYELGDIKDQFSAAVAFPNRNRPLMQKQ